MHITEPSNRECWSIDPDRTAIIIPDYPQRCVSTELLLWVTMRFNAKNVMSITKKDQCVMRNSAVRDIVRRLPSKFEWFVMFDCDMSPSASSDEFWVPDTDIVGVQCNHEDPNVWAKPTDIHCNGFRFNRKVATSLPLPWFRKEYSEDGCEQLGCSCQHFTRKALAGGFTVSRAGWMRHTIQRAEHH